MTFRLNPALDASALAAIYAATGRVEIPDLLADDGAQALRDHLLARDDWTVVLNAGERVWEMAERDEASLTTEQRAGLDARVLAAARDGFQYRYSSIRVRDHARDGGGMLDAFAAFMASDPVLAFFRQVTRQDAIAFADAQATRYRGGDFLTAHDDGVAGKGRIAAYVFGLAPGWRTEWGGLLLFHGDRGTVEHGFVPAMGTLRLFAVPVEHSVSWVTPIAPEPRLSVTGWLRDASALG